MFKTVLRDRSGGIDRSARKLGTLEIGSAGLTRLPGGLLLPERALVELIASTECLQDRDRADQHEIHEREQQQGLDRTEAPRNGHPSIQQSPPERDLLTLQLGLRCFSFQAPRDREAPLRPRRAATAGSKTAYWVASGANEARSMTCGWEIGNIAAF